MLFIVNLAFKLIVWAALIFMTYYILLKCLVFISKDKEKTLEKRLRYYHKEWAKGAAMIENEEYDKLKLRLEKMNSDNKFLRELKLNAVLGSLYESYPRVRNQKVKNALKGSIKIISEMHGLNLGDPSEVVNPETMYYNIPE